jgi:crotonobetainyl-CoA:carnitine CoA-transferase CaiB-like acyl-CoA transferase
LGGNDEQFRRFCEATGIPEFVNDERFARNGLHLKHADILGPPVARAFGGRTVSECQKLLNEAGVPVALINDMA